MTIITGSYPRRVHKMAAPTCARCKFQIWLKGDGGAQTHIGYIPQHRWVDGGPQCFNTQACRFREKFPKAVKR